jgi:hypothetical protein
MCDAFSVNGEPHWAHGRVTWFFRQATEQKRAVGLLRGTAKGAPHRSQARGMLCVRPTPLHVGEQ